MPRPSQKTSLSADVRLNGFSLTPAALIPAIKLSAPEAAALAARAASIILPSELPQTAIPAPINPTALMSVPVPTAWAARAVSINQPSAISATALQTVARLRQADAEQRLNDVLPRLYDQASGATETLPVAAAVREDYAQFLTSLGFRDYPAAIAANLRQGGQNGLQMKVLEFNAKRYRVINAGRELAAEVMSGLAEQGYSQEAMYTGTELAARLLSLQPLDPPSSLPPEVARLDKTGIRRWLIEVTVQKISAQLAQVVSDVAKTAVPTPILQSGLDALGRGEKDTPEARELLGRIQRIKEPAERVLITAYTDAEAGQTRYAGRALAASLVRFARKAGRPEVEESLKKELALRGLWLENFVGDTLVLPDQYAAGGITRLKLNTGDFIGERSGGREAAGITFFVQPARSGWFPAFRQKLHGHLLGLWANPKVGLKLVAGQPLRNRLKQLIWDFKKWLAGRNFLEKGYSHVGMASLEESDGVVMTWALDNYPNSGEGGIRKIGVAEEFAQQGAFLKFGAAHFDADRVWDAFHAQAAATGYQDHVYFSGKTGWPSLISREDYSALLAIPRGESSRLLTELAHRAAGAIEEMLTSLGVGFSTKFINELWSAYCSSTMVLAYRMGGQFEIQSAFDHWHPLVRIMKWLGLPVVKDLNTNDRIIWPGSLFIDPKIARHRTVVYPPYRAAGRLSSPYYIPAYEEMDRQLTLDLQSLSRISDEGSINPEPDIIAGAIHQYLDTRAQKSRIKDGPYRAGIPRSRGYSAGLDQLLRDTDTN